MENLEPGDMVRSTVRLWISSDTVDNSLPLINPGDQTGLLHYMGSAKFTGSVPLPPGSIGEVRSVCGDLGFWYVEFEQASDLLEINSHRVICMCLEGEIKKIHHLEVLAMAGISNV